MAKLSKYEQAARKNMETLASRYGGYTPPSSAPAPAAPPPAPMYGAASTHDAQYNAALGLAGLQRDNALASLAGNAERLRANYGYADDLHNIDPNNPFGQAQLLKRNYDQTVKGTTNSYAARGQQTSGAFNRMQGNNLFNFQQRDDALQKSYDQARADLLAQVAGVGNEYAGAAIGAEGDALSRALQNRNAYQTGGGSKGLASNERVATSAKDGGQWVYRLTNGKWLRVRKA